MTDEEHSYFHPGYKKPYPIETVLRDLAAQEGCDDEPYDAMVFAAACIEALTEQLAAARQDAKEAEAYAEELEACNRGLVRLNEATQDRADRAEAALTKAVEALEEISEYDTGATAGLAYTAKHHLAEIKGASHE